MNQASTPYIQNETIQYNIECEKSILGLILTVNELVYDALEYLTEEDFYNVYNREIFRIIKVINEHSTEEKIKEIDHEEIHKYVSTYGSKYFTTEEGLKDFSEKPFLLDYLSTLLYNAGYPKNILAYYDELTRLTSLRNVENTIKNALNDLKNNKTIDPNLLLNNLEMKFIDIVKTKRMKDYLTAKEASKEYYDYLSILKHSSEDDIAGVPSGFKQLDSMTQGFKKGELIILAARPAMGKTAFALNIANNVAKRGRKAAFASLEMDSNQLMSRIYAANTLIEGSKFKKPNLFSPIEWNNISIIKDSIDKMQLFIDDSTSSDINEILWKIRRLHKLDKVDILIIDYLQLIAISNKSGNNRQVEVSKISRSLKQLARELEIPIIALSQLSRGVEQREDKRPLLSDLRESGAIEQDADIVMFLYRENYYSNKSIRSDKKSNDNFASYDNDAVGDVTELIIAKHRNGPTGKIKLRFQLPFSKFSDLIKDE